MPTMTAVPEDHPLMIAWKTYQATDDFANTKKWAMHHEHVQGTLWAAFMAGFQARQVAATEARNRTLDEAANIATTAYSRRHEFPDIFENVAPAIRALKCEPEKIKDSPSPSPPSPERDRT